LVILRPEDAEIVAFGAHNLDIPGEFIFVFVAHFHLL
jgi:hypothetical protein